MSFDWVNYLHLEEELSEGEIPEIPEAKKRSAISRAYYAAFNIAFDFGFNTYEDFEFTINNIHDDVASWFDNHVPRIGQELRDLRKWRNRSDYDDVTEGLDDLVIKGITHSKKIIDKIDDHKNLFETILK